MNLKTRLSCSFIVPQRVSVDWVGSSIFSDYVIYGGLKLAGQACSAKGTVTLVQARKMNGKIIFIILLHNPMVSRLVC